MTGTDAAGLPWRQEVSGQATTGETLTNLWGRARVRELEDRYASQLGVKDERLSHEIVAVSLESHVLSRFTAYVAVDRSEVVKSDGKPREIVQPVELPEGWLPPQMASGRLYALACSPEPSPLMKELFQVGAPALCVPQAPLTITEVLDRLAAALKTFKSRSLFSKRRRRLLSLIDVLQMLETMMQKERHPRWTEASELLDSARSMLAELDRFGRHAWVAGTIEDFLTKVQTFLDELRQSAEPARSEFWK